MEVGQVIWVAGPPPVQGGTHRIPVMFHGGIHQAMVDLACMQSTSHQNLVQPRALVEASLADIRFVHRDIQSYPAVSVEIRHGGKEHSIKVVVSSHLAHLLILGTDWPGFNKLVGQCVEVHS